MTAPAGWYIDGPSQRYWDGEKWTEHIAPLPAPQLPLKSVGISYLFFLLLGGFGAHQFYLRNPGAAIGQILLWWGGWATTGISIGYAALVAVAIWWLIDLVTLPTQTEITNTYIRAAKG